MGACIAGSDHRPLTSTSALPSHLLRMRLICEQKQPKLQAQLHDQQDILIGEFNKSPAYRSQSTELALINCTITTLNTKTLYLILEAECRKLLDNKHQMQNWEKMEGFLPSVHTLLLCSTFMKDEQLSKIARTVRTAYGERVWPKEEDVRHALVKSMARFEEPSFEMQNQYVLEFSHRTQIPLQRICEIGHPYKFLPQ